MYSLGSEKGIVSGVEKAIGTMKETESARICVMPQYGYGEEGCAELGIPEGAELVYEVRMNKFTKVSKWTSCENVMNYVTKSKHT